MSDLNPQETPLNSPQHGVQVDRFGQKRPGRWRFLAKVDVGSAQSEPSSSLACLPSHAGYSHLELLILADAGITSYSMITGRWCVAKEAQTTREGWVPHETTVNATGVNSIVRVPVYDERAIGYISALAGTGSVRVFWRHAQA